jgi:phage terminase small subunit
MSNVKLLPQHRAFIAKYLSNGYNGTRAYLAIKPNASYDTARAEASRYLSHHCIQEAIRAHLDKADVHAIASRQYLIRQAHEIGEEARAEGQYNPALTSVDLKAKLNKLYDRNEDDMSGYAALVQQLIVVNPPAPDPDVSTPEPIDITPTDPD